MRDRGETRGKNNGGKKEQGKHTPRQRLLAAALKCQHAFAKIHADAQGGEEDVSAKWRIKSETNAEVLEGIQFQSGMVRYHPICINLFGFYQAHGSMSVTCRNSGTHITYTACFLACLTNLCSPLADPLAFVKICKLDAWGGRVGN